LLTTFFDSSIFWFLTNLILLQVLHQTLPYF